MIQTYSISKMILDKSYVSYIKDIIARDPIKIKSILKQIKLIKLNQIISNKSNFMFTQIRFLLDISHSVYFTETIPLYGVKWNSFS